MTTKMTVAEVKASFFAGANEVRRMYRGRKPIKTPTNPCKDGGVVNRDKEWNEAVRCIANEFGWTDNRFLYHGGIVANGGKVKPGAYAVPSFFGGMYRPVWNIDDIEWPNGIPTEWKKPERKPDAKKPTRKVTRKVTRKAAPKKGDYDAAMKEMQAELKAMREMNANLTAAVAALIGKVA